MARRCRHVPFAVRCREVKSYQLVRVRTRNSLGWFATEEEALREVLAHVDEVGAERALGIALYRGTSHGEELIAADDDLVQRALKRSPLPYAVIDEEAAAGWADEAREGLSGSLDELRDPWLS